MKKIKLYGLIFFGLILIVPATTKAANTSSGISNDYYIKLQEEKSALEYRISSLETSSYNSPDLSSLNIQSRIDDLIRERETEKNYIKGLYGKNGISNQLTSALSKIDSKYQSQIDSLNQQKTYYQNQTNRQQSTNNDLIQTQLRIQELDRKLEEQNKLIQSLKTQTYSPTPSSSEETLNPVDLFNYIDNLDDPISAKALFMAVKDDNIDLYNQVVELAKAKYINKFFGNKKTTADMFQYLAGSQLTDDVKLVIGKMVIFTPDLMDKFLELLSIKNYDTNEITINKLTASEILEYLDYIEYSRAYLSLQKIEIKYPSIYKSIISLAESKYFSGKTNPDVMFAYMDSLSKSDMEKLYNRLLLFNPALIDQVNELVREKYPDGKFFSESELQQKQKVTTPQQVTKVVPKTSFVPISSASNTPIIEEGIEKQEDVAGISQQPEITSTSSASKISKDVHTKKTFIQKTVDFFRSFIFWK